MALILSIETTTEICSIAISKDGESIYSIIDNEKNAHSQKLITYIETAFRDLKIEMQSLDAVAISHGPGSYTGLRIGMSVAKALCYALDKPLISVSTLHAMAQACIYQTEAVASDFFVIPMIDARRMEVFMCVVDQNMEEKKEVCSLVIEPESFAKWLTKPCYFVGNGAEKCKEQFEIDSNAYFPEVLASAEHLIDLAEIAFEKNDFVDIAYCEPFYLKEYIAGKPNVKGLRT